MATLRQQPNHQRQQPARAALEIAGATGVTKCLNHQMTMPTCRLVSGRSTLNSSGASCMRTPKIDLDEFVLPKCLRSRRRFKRHVNIPTIDSCGEPTYTPTGRHAENANSRRCCTTQPFMERWWKEHPKSVTTPCSHSTHLWDMSSWTQDARQRWLERTGTMR